MKTAGTSVEVYLSQYCGEDDVVTPIEPHVDPHIARNYRGLWNPVPEIMEKKAKGIRRDLRDFFRLRKFYNHIPAWSVQKRVPKHIWDSYYKFCIERNPWDKTLSDYSMFKDRAEGKLSLDDYLSNGRFCLNYPKYTNEKGKLIVNRVIKYETLSDSLGEVFEMLGIPYSGSLDVKAKSEHRRNTAHYSDVLDEKQSQLIEKAFSKEIDMHGYTY
jgi:hypothetical protein